MTNEDRQGCLHVEDQDYQHDFRSLDVGTLYAGARTHYTLDKAFKSKNNLAYRERDRERIKVFVGPQKNEPIYPFIAPDIFPKQNCGPKGFLPPPPPPK